MRLLTSLLISVLYISALVNAVQAEETALRLHDLRNNQVNTPTMVSSGLPDRAHFEELKSNGVVNVIDLIPGDRSEESKLMGALGLQYRNIKVLWENPTIENFDDYAAAIQRFESEGGVTLTHCQLNWRGAVFTCLYRVIHLHEAENIAKQDLDAIWQPNDVWLNFIEDVKTKNLQ